MSLSLCSRTTVEQFVLAASPSISCIKDNVWPTFPFLCERVMDPKSSMNKCQQGIRLIILLFCSTSSTCKWEEENKLCEMSQIHILGLDLFSLLFC
mmetsp:Transcript_4240/g.9401  ORF Transcript_4240/g.9401 Transcript_4240/m.9401 type:complete len:96 (+) Transcript_4240:2316-2603(+)